MSKESNPSAGAATATQVNPQVAALEAQVTALKTENEALKTENAQLKELMAAGKLAPELEALVAGKVAAGLSRDQALQVVRHQAEHDAAQKALNPKPAK